MKLIVGLGNLGEKYEKSRHNVGFMVLDELLRELVPVKKTTWKDIPHLKSKIYNLNRAKISSSAYSLKSEVVLAKPQTMMNASGFAVAKLASSFQLPASSIWVIHDDLDLPLGKIKIRSGGGTAGHHGLDSLLKELGSGDFVRFRLGIGHPAKAGKWEVGGGKLVSQNVKHKEVEEYVLEEFIGKEKTEAEKMVKKAVEALNLALKRGIEAAMNKYNLR